MRYDKALWDILKEIDDIEDPTFEFLASCFSYCLAKGGLTDKQAKIIDKYIILISIVIYGLSLIKTN